MTDKGKIPKRCLSSPNVQRVRHKQHLRVKNQPKRKPEMKYNVFNFQLSGSRKDLSTSQDSEDSKVRKNALNSSVTVQISSSLVCVTDQYVHSTSLFWETTHNKQ